MTRKAVTLALVALAIAGLMAMPASAAPLHSDNVRLLGKRPEAAGAIGARFSPDGKTMYVTAATGLFIYDVTDPEPRPAGLPGPAALRERGRRRGRRDRGDHQ